MSNSKENIILIIVRIIFAIRSWGVPSISIHKDAPPSSCLYGRILYIAVIRLSIWNVPETPHILRIKYTIRFALTPASIIKSSYFGFFIGVIITPVPLKTTDSILPPVIFIAIRCPISCIRQTA